MELALVALLLAAAAPAGSAAPVVRHEEPPAEPVRPLATPRDLSELCRAITPTERVRPRGDAVEQGEEAQRHDEAREAALAARYQVTIPAGKLAFAPWDGPERRLGLAEPAQLVALGGAARLWPVEARDLAVEADAGTARRVLDAQRAGRLTLVLAFDLPEDAACAGGRAARRVTLPVDPVDWAWQDGDTVLARGGAGADRPVMTAAQGARPRVSVGDPIAGPAEAKRGVVARVGELEACYLEALKADPGIDGVMVAELSGAKPVVAADSTGSAELGECVRRALGTLGSRAAAGRVAVPIRFELVAPAAEPAVPPAPAAPPPPGGDPSAAGAPPGRAGPHP